jgi:putative hydrolase of the HAD superfamily
MKPLTPSTKITTFIFDCFGVVCSPVLNKWYKVNSQLYRFIDENLQNVFRQFDLGKLSEDDMADYFLKYKGINLTKEEIRKEIDGYLTLDVGLVDIIKKLKQKGFKVALLSNANSSFFKRKIYPTYPELKNLFDEIIISSDVGMVKPDDDIYLYTLDKIGSKPEESVFVDDGKVNIDTANKLGIRGFLYTDSAAFADYVKSLGIEIRTDSQS